MTSGRAPHVTSPLAQNPQPAQHPQRAPETLAVVWQEFRVTGSDSEAGEGGALRKPCPMWEPQVATMNRLSSIAFGGMMALLWTSSCAQPQEAPSVNLPVMVDRSGIVETTSDRGYRIRLTHARVVIQNIAFAVNGEAHGAEAHEAGEEISLLSWLIPSAYAHPGHYEGGEVTGELQGRFILDWLASSKEPQKVGTAMLLHGNYTSANFVFGRGTEADGLQSRDPLLGHTAVLRGTASKGEFKVEFEAVIDSPEGREVLGIPFELAVSDSTKVPLGFRLHTLGVIQEDCLFDGVDFSTLEGDENGILHIEANTQDSAVRRAYRRLRRSFQTQEQYDIKATTMKKLAKLAAQGSET